MYVTASLIICRELEVGGGHHRAREPEENKIISLSDGPPLGLAHSRLPIEFIFPGIQGGGIGAQSEGKAEKLVQQRLPQVRSEERAGPHLLGRWSPGPLEGPPSGA